MTVSVGKGELDYESVGQTLSRAQATTVCQVGIKQASKVTEKNNSNGKTN